MDAYISHAVGYVVCPEQLEKYLEPDSRHIDVGSAKLHLSAELIIRKVLERYADGQVRGHLQHNLQAAQRKCEHVKSY